MIEDEIKKLLNENKNPLVYLIKRDFIYDLIITNLENYSPDVKHTKHETLDRKSVSYSTSSLKHFENSEELTLNSYKYETNTYNLDASKVRISTSFKININDYSEAINNLKKLSIDIRKSISDRVDIGFHAEFNNKNILIFRCVYDDYFMTYTIN